MTESTKPGYAAALNLFRIITLLRLNRRGLTAQALAERLGISRRTLKRYIDTLADLRDAPEDVHRLRTEYTDQGILYRLYEKPIVGAKNKFQYVALYSAIQQMSAVEDQILSNSARDILDDLERSLDPRFVRRLQSGFHYLPYGPKDYGTKEESVEAIISAVVMRWAVQITYRYPNTGEMKSFTFQPWTIVVFRAGLYAYGPRSEDGKFVTLALERIQALHPLKDQPFDVPDDYDPAAHFSGRFGLFNRDGEPADVQLAFPQSVAGWVRDRRWPGLVGFADHPDGRLVMTLRLVPTEELTSWILSWGHKVEVLADSLRHEIVQSLTDATSVYATPMSTPTRKNTPTNPSPENSP